MSAAPPDSGAVERAGARRDADATLALLAEIRDTGREHLALYREQSQRALAVQESSVRLQAQSARLYRAVVLAGGVLVLGLLAAFALLLLPALLR